MIFLILWQHYGVPDRLHIWHSCIITIIAAIKVAGKSGFIRLVSQITHNINYARFARKKLWELFKIVIII